MKGAEMVPVEIGTGQVHASVTERSRGLWPPETIALIGQTVAKGATPQQLGMFLEVAAKYELDPLTREIWCAVPKNRNGEYDTERVLIMVGRDGYLKIANRSGELEALTFGVVYENDEFQVVHEGEDVTVRHAHGVGAGRGPMIGAWAIGRRRGRAPVFHFAYLTEYEPRNLSSFSPWSNQRSAMILKCAQSYVLRVLFGVTGVVAEEESERLLEQMGEVRVGTPVVERDRPAPIRALAERLEFLYERANEARPGSFSPAKRSMLMSGMLEAPDFEHAIVVAEDWFRKRKLDVPIGSSRPKEESGEPMEGAQGDADAPSSEGDAEPVESVDDAGSAADAPETADSGAPDDDGGDPEGDEEPEADAESPWARRKREGGAQRSLGQGEELG